MALMKKLTSALVASSLVLSLVGTASATTPDKIDAAAKRMVDLGLLKGRGGSDGLALHANLTRAEMVTVIVRAFGQEDSAKYLEGVAAFSDTANHPWASGYIAMAKRLMEARGVTEMGYPDGTFRPDANVTVAEAVAFVMKAVGAPADNTLPWPDNYLQGALNAGIITAEDLAYLETVKNQPATRGLAFYLADSAFYGYKLASGSTVYRTFVDTIAPELTVDEVPAVTLDSKITITGTVSGAEAVFVGTPENAATITDGTFSIDVPLAMGENTIVVTAVDLVGNPTEKILKVTRTVGPAVGIQAEDITVAAGETVDVAAAVVDEAGNVIEGVEITGESDVGTFADGKFTAGTKAGEGKLVLKSGEFTKEVKVTVTPAQLYTVKAAKSFVPGEPVQLLGVDAYGNVIEGVTFSEDSPYAFIEGDILIVTKEGTYTITGTLGDITVTGTVAPYGEVADIAIEADKDSLVANTSSTVTITVKAVDANGNLVADFAGYAVYKGDLVVDDEDAYFEADGGYAVAEVKDGVATFVLKTADTRLAGDEAELEFALFEDYNEISTGDPVAEAEFVIEVVEQEATAFKLEADDYFAINAANETEVKVFVVDQDGEKMLDGDDYDFTIEVNGPAYLLDEDGDEVDSLEFDDEYIDEEGFSVPIYAEDDDATGTITVRVTSEDLKTAEATIKAVIAGKARGIEITSDEDDPIAVADVETDRTAEGGTYTVRVVDSKGVPTTADRDVEITVNVSGAAYVGSVYVLGAANDVDGDESTESDEWQQLLSDSFTLKINKGEGEAEFSLASKVAQTIELVAEDEDDKLSDSNTYKVVFEAGQPKNIAILGHADATAHANIINIVPKQKMTLVAQLYDQFGNPVAKAGYLVKIAEAPADVLKVNGKTGSKVTDLNLRTDKNGQVKLDVEITDNDAEGTFGLKLEVVELDLEQTITLKPEYDVPKKVTVKVMDSTTTTRVREVTPGQTYTLDIAITDEDNDPINLDDDDVAYRITSSAYVEWDDENPLQFTVPAGLDVSRITFKVELLGFGKVVSATDSVKVVRPSTYEFTVDTDVDVFKATQTPVTVDAGKLDGGDFNPNVEVTLKTKEVGDYGYDRVRIDVEITQLSGESGEVYLIAYDEDSGRYWDIAAIRRWGPTTGFELDNRYSATTPIMAQFTEPGVYQITFTLVEVDADGSVVSELTSETAYATVVN